VGIHGGDAIIEQKKKSTVDAGFEMLSLKPAV
jgi:hypothetical protein